MKQSNESRVPSNLRTHIVHLHNGNSSSNVRRGNPYLTICELLDKKTNEVMSRAKAYCSKQDNPSRKLGREISIGRALSYLNQ